ncbi:MULTISPECIES: DUF2283 domain-containing protein [Thermococcus]|uniref:DUF2283 domain-containing protein n=1 Tax=Thermococcus barophilus TaxID=55802 RepID=A0A0S1XAS8_THEBA|nr:MULTISPECIES: DUF2283 domain-containing protein [Thermococcus]ALM74852.1 hypothetical protein TBCH5v1_0900 [Thermococcus barophilus]WRS52160.1 DUF2283 domain-containing protein [Thermococcus sp. SY098]
MKVRYDPKTNILYILIKEGEVYDTEEIDEDIWIEYDENGNIMGIEIWNAGEKIIMNALKAIEKQAKAY